MKNSKKLANYPILIIFVLLMASCSNDDRDPIPTDTIYIHIPDIIFETKLIEQGIDSDGIINQQILKTDAEAVNSLNLSFSGEGEISDMTGIEGFINLTYLSAVQNAFTEIDLSSNTLLDTLRLQGNNLGSFDISNNPKLILLDLTSTLLSSFSGAEEATQLKELRVSFNYLEEFRLENESIEHLLISHNLLTSINLSGAPNLTGILLTSNFLTAIDLSSNTALETLLISDNKLTSLDIEQNSHLAYLYISSNLLTNLDVSYNQELVDLWTRNNPNLTCIKIQNGQDIPTVDLSDYQSLNETCD